MTTHAEVAHNWAHQTGKKQNGHHMYYDGNVIYSYGRHFPIARIVSGVILLTDRSYSVSTAKHKTITWSAARLRPCSVLEGVFFMATAPEEHCHNRDHYEQKFHAMIKSAKRRRKVGYAEMDLRRAEYLALERQQYCAHFGVLCAPLMTGSEMSQLRYELIAKKRIAA